MWSLRWPWAVAMAWGRFCLGVIPSMSMYPFAKAESRDESGGDSIAALALAVFSRVCAVRDY